MQMAVARVIVCMVVVLAVGSCHVGEAAAIGCGTVIGYARPCLPYVMNKGPLGFCCRGVNSILAAAKTKDDRQSVCRCLKTLASIATGIDLDKAASIPDKCAVSIPYKISPSTDCSTVT